MKFTRLAALALSAALLAGCAPDSTSAPGGMSTPETSGTPAAQSGPKVQVDWSVLERRRTEPLADVDGGRWFPDYTDRLVTGEDYGLLIPYAGTNVYSVTRWQDEAGQEHRETASWPTQFYGLMTRTGKIVTDPVYLSAEQAVYYWQGERFLLPVLLLSQANEEWGEINCGRRYAAAAVDGSWCTGFDFWDYTVREDGLLFCGPGGVTRLDAASGARQDWLWASLGVTEEELPQLMETLIWVYGLSWTDRGIYLGEEDIGQWTDGPLWDKAQIRVFQPETGEVTWTSREQWEEWQSQWYAQRNGPDQGAWQVERDGTQVVVSRGEEFYTLIAPGLGESFGFEAGGPFAVLCDFSGEQTQSRLFRLADGEELLEGSAMSFLTDGKEGEAPYVLVQDGSFGFTLYSPELRPLFSAPGGNWGYGSISCGLVTLWDCETFFGVWDLERGDWIFYRNLDLGD